MEDNNPSFDDLVPHVKQELFKNAPANKIREYVSGLYEENEYMTRRAAMGQAAMLVALKALELAQGKKAKAKKPAKKKKRLTDQLRSRRK